MTQRERDGGRGQPPVKSEVRAQSNKVDTLVFGGRCSRISGGTPEARSRLCVCRASFLMTFVMSRMPHRLPAGQASLSFTIFLSLLELMFIESVMPSNHLVLCCPASPLALNFFPASGSFPMSQFFMSDGQSIGVSALASVLPRNIQD